ncbi:MAG: hypothetical protein IAI50_14820, partial [Candidatus Eremiobacteraeota bacterium]|nr:hypothetical protein [Candidatus Eremiobacteraeota bacterium]
MISFFRQATVLTLLALCAGRAPAAETLVPGHVVLAKPGGDAVIIWDATPVVVTIVDG